MVTQAAETLITENLNMNPEQNRSPGYAQDKFFTLSLDMFFIAGCDGVIKDVNAMCQKTLRLTAAELVNKPLVAFVHPEDRESTLAQLQKLTTNLDTVSFENRYRCQDGAYKWLLWNAALCHDQQLIYAVARDITQRKQAEQALKENEERFRLIVENVKDYAIYMLDTSGRIVSWNQGAQSLNGYRAEEMVGQHFSRVYVQAEIQAGKPEEVLDIAARVGKFEGEMWRSRKDGTRFWAHVVVTALRNETGELRGFVTVTRNRTERKQAEEALKQAYDDLETRVEARTAELQAANTLLKQEINERKRTEVALRQSKARLKNQAVELEQALLDLQNTQAQLIQTEKMSSLGQMIAGVAHEINNPVSFIYGNIEHASFYIESLMRLLQLYIKHYPQPDIEIQETIEEIDLDFVLADIPNLISSMKMGAERIRQIVLSLRNFSRYDQSEMKAVNIHEGIDSTLLILQNRLKAKADSPAIQVIKEYGDLPLVECYAGQLNQVFMNLISNAVDALEERQEEAKNHLVYRNNSSEPARKPCIWIRTEMKTDELAEENASASKVRIRIIDNGPGMTEEVCQKLFDPFFTTKPVGKGTGLGLSISYQIVVENHGGQLTCVSEVGKETEFVIEIPLHQPQPLVS